jgi:hypothetical protein
MIAEAILLFVFLNHQVHGWTKPERGAFQPFSLESAPLELLVERPIGDTHNFLVKLHFGDKENSTIHRTISWKMPENR